MRRILLLDSNEELRAQLAEAIAKTRNTEAIVVADEAEVLARLGLGVYAAVFADAALLTNGARPLVDAVRSAIVRPMVVVASNEKPEDLDPDLVTLVVRKPYDVQTVTGILVSAVMDLPPAADAAAEAAVC